MKELAFLEKREIVKAYCEQKSSLFKNTEPRMVEICMYKEGGLFKVYYILFYCRKLKNKIFAVKSRTEQ